MGMSGYTKLFSTIIHSTIWGAADHVRLVWITMLAMADRRGIVEASEPGLATASRVTLEECLDALTNLSSPDLYSRSKEQEGRRIQKVDGGWLLINYAKYRKLMSDADQREKARVRTEKWRAKCNGRDDSVTPGDAGNDPVTAGNACDDIAEAEAEAEAGGVPPKPPAPIKSRKKALRPMPTDWEPNATATARARTLRLDLPDEVDSFKLWTEAKGSMFASWDAAFLNHLKSQATRRDERGGQRSEADWKKTKAESTGRHYPLFRDIPEDQMTDDERYPS